jgi:acyl-CoA hydrolase
LVLPNSPPHITSVSSNKHTDKREKAVNGEFTFVAIDENKKPIKVLD